MKAPRPLPNGTPVFETDGNGNTLGTGVVCDHETNGSGSIVYHIAFDWPRRVRGVDSEFVKPQPRKKS